MAVNFWTLEKWRETKDHCEGTRIIVSFRDRCPQVRVITEGHYSLPSVGSCVFVCCGGHCFRRLPAADYKGVAFTQHPNVTHKRQKCGSTEGVSAPFRYFAVNLTDGLGLSRALAMRSAVASKTLCNLQKHHRQGESDCLTDTHPTKRASEALMKGR